MHKIPPVLCMKKEMPKPVMRVYNGELKLENDTLKKLFLQQLDNVYCIKKHLVKVLPSFAENASFPDLKAAILESTDQIKLQILRMDVIYKIFNAAYRDHYCVGVKTLSLETYMATKVDGQLPVERDLNLLIHLQITESVEVAYFGVLKKIAANLENEEVKILLDQNFESAIHCKNLYKLIAREYIA